MRVARISQGGKKRKNFFSPCEQESSSSKEEPGMNIPEEYLEPQDKQQPEGIKEGQDTLPLSRKGNQERRKCPASRGKSRGRGGVRSSRAGRKGGKRSAIGEREGKRGTTWREKRGDQKGGEEGRSVSIIVCEEEGGGDAFRLSLTTEEGREKAGRGYYLLQEKWEGGKRGS